MNARRLMAAALLGTAALVACDDSATAPDALESRTASSETRAQGPNGAPNVPGPLGPAQVLEWADELGLTAGQIAGIEVIETELKALNDPLWQELRDGRLGNGGPPSGGPGPRGSVDDPVLKEIRANTLAAMKEIGELLTSEQRERLRGLLQEHRRHNR